MVVESKTIQPHTFFERFQNLYSKNAKNVDVYTYSPITLMSPRTFAFGIQDRVIPPIRQNVRGGGKPSDG